MKEAMLYQRLDDGIVQCAVCNHRCRISEGSRGICGVRENRGGKLYALNYEKAIAVHIDPIEKKPLYHFLPRTQTYSFATAGCNFRCIWCQNWEISQRPKPDKPVDGLPISPAEHVRQALAHECQSISYTYSEPTIFMEYAFATMKLAKDHDLKNIWVTNGYMTTDTLELVAPLLDAANVDFKGPDDGVYEKYCGGRAKPVMETLKYLCAAGVHQEITTLVVPGVNDRADQLEQIAGFIAGELGVHVPWHVTRFFPAWKMSDTPPTPLETLLLAKEIGKRAGLNYVHTGNV